MQNNEFNLRIPCVFSTQSKIPKRMDGIQLHAYSHKIYWYAEEDDEGKLTIRPLNAEFLPSGVKIAISALDLSKGYAPEPEIYEMKMVPKQCQVDGIVEKAEFLREEKNDKRAAVEYRRALAIDEEHIKANFGAGLVHLSLGELDKARVIFRRLLKLQGTFEKQHKHMFNEFGMSMRKHKMLSESIEYYGRALQLTQDDPNLHINIARALCEQKQYASSVGHILEALNVDPGNKMALDFLSWMNCNKFVPVHHAPAVEKILSERAKAPATCDVIAPSDDLFG